MDKKKQHKLAKAMKMKLDHSPWKSVWNFTVGSGIERLVSKETVRRMFDEDNDHFIEPYRQAYVMRYLGFEPNEIREMLQNYTTDTELYKLIGGDGGKPLSPPDEAMLRVYHRLEEEGALPMLVAQIQLIANAMQIGLSADIAQLAKQPVQPQRRGENVKSL